MKNTVYHIQNFLSGFNSRINTTGENINECEEIVIEEI